MTFAELLRAHVAVRGIAQNQLARRTGINVGTINRLIRGHRDPATREQIQQLAMVLGLTIYEYDELLFAAGHICSSCPMARYMRDKTRDQIRACSR